MTARRITRRPSHGEGGLHRDQRGFIARFIIKAMAVFAILGVVAYDGGQVVVAQIKAQGVARAAAQAATDNFFLTKNVRTAEEAGLDAAKQEDPTARVTSIQVNADGSATASVTKTASTLIIGRISALKHFGVQQATEDASHFV